MLGAGTWREIAIGAIVGLVVIGFVAERWGWGPARDMTIAMVATLGSMWWQHRRRKARDAAPGGPPMPRRR